MDNKDQKKWTLEGVKRSFNGRLIGSLRMRKKVLETLLNLPPEMVKFITTHIWFVSSPQDAWALTFKGSDIANQHLVLLSHELLDQDKEMIKYTILHEIGHVILNHRNSMGFRQSETEINQQEREADEFARKYLTKVALLGK